MAENTVSQEISSVTLSSTGSISVVGLRHAVIGGMELYSTFAESYEPGQDLTALPENIQAICAAWWDAAVLKTHAELTAAAAADGSDQFFEVEP